MLFNLFKKKMKKVVLLLSVVAVIALGSCGNKQVEAPPAPETEAVVEEATATEEVAEEVAEEAVEAEKAEVRIAGAGRQWLRVEHHDGRNAHAGHPPAGVSGGLAAVPPVTLR